MEAANHSRISNHYDFVKPNDIRALRLMNAAAQHVLKMLPDIVISYGHSDEYSFVFHKSCTLWERRAAKIASTVVSTFTAAYIFLWNQNFSGPPPNDTYLRSTVLAEGDTAAPHDSHNQEQLLDLMSLPTFDGRSISYPSNQNLRDYLSWRQADCHINNLYNTTFWALVLKGGMTNTDAENFLKGTLSSDKNEILWSKFAINYNNEPEIYKKGSIVLREYELEDIPDKQINSTSHLDENFQIPTQGLSRTQIDKIRKAKQKAKIVVRHVDLIKDDFWLQRPWLLTGQPGKPVS